MPEIDRDLLWEVVIVVAPLGLSPGKLIGQAFQAASRSGIGVPGGPWREQGTRTIVRFAKTPAIFERVCAEIPGWVMRDEGFTEVEADAATLFVCDPFVHRDRPKLLDNKRLSNA